MPPVDVWRSATMQSGAHCVVTSGTLKRLKWSAGNWDTKLQVIMLSEY
jgi:hypothetical protein